MIMRHLLILTISAGLCLTDPATAQSLIGRDTILARERTLDRPLNLHGGQLRFSAGYGINLHNHEFDVEGTKSSLVKDGLSSLRHQGWIDLRYGLSEHLQLSLLYGYSNETIMERTILLYGYPAGLIGSEINESATYKGADDLNIQVDFRLPFKTRRFDLLLQAGSELPTAPTKPYQPDHRIGLDATGEVQQVRYDYRYATGKGAVTPFLGAVWKHRFGSVAYTLYGNYRHSMSEATIYRWESALTDGAFENEAIPEQRTLPDEIRLGGEFEMQLSPLFNLSVQAQYRSQQDGWQTSAFGPVEEEDTRLLQAGLGYELIVTPRLWLRQRLLLPISGMSVRAGTILQSTLSYNLFLVK